jgi:hypothetical protein
MSSSSSSSSNSRAICVPASSPIWPAMVGPSRRQALCRAAWLQHGRGQLPLREVQQLVPLGRRPQEHTAGSSCGATHTHTAAAAAGNGSQALL